MKKCNTRQKMNVEQTNRDKNPLILIVTREQLLSQQLIIHAVCALAGEGITCTVFWCRSYVQCTVASNRN